MASAAEVAEAFRWLLGRAPGPGDVEAAAAIPAGALRDAICRTDAFRGGLPADAMRLPPDYAPGPIQTEADPDTVAALLREVGASWEALGRDRPHWSTNARPEFLPDAIGSHADSFAQTGAADLRVLLASLARHGLSARDFPRAVDYGCGVGRVTVPMAATFAEVTGCDVSTAHLALARQAAGARVRFSLVTPDGFGLHAPFDLWFSLLALQHSPPPVTVLILRRMFALLAPGGVAAFQVPTALAGYRYGPGDGAGAAMGLHVLPQAVVFRLAHEAGCVPLEVREDLLIWPPTHCTSNSFLFRKPPGPHPA